jgi:hypothetical protein
MSAQSQGSLWMPSGRLVVLTLSVLLQTGVNCRVTPLAFPLPLCVADQRRCRPLQGGDDDGRRLAEVSRGTPYPSSARHRPVAQRSSRPHPSLRRRQPPVGLTRLYRGRRAVHRRVGRRERLVCRRPITPDTRAIRPGDRGGDQRWRRSRRRQPNARYAPARTGP